MNEQHFSLAVVRGADAGSVLRTRRRRIAVGSAADNDLVIHDPEVAPRHLLVLIEDDRWRVHSLGALENQETDDAWIHPTTGVVGACVALGASELILCPGLLGDDVVASEVKRRTGPLVQESLQGLGASPTEPVELLDVHRRFERLVRSEPRLSRSRSPVRVLREEPTQPDPMSHDPTAATPGLGAAGHDIDLVQLSQMETIAGERLPDSLVSAARVRLSDERGPLARLEAPLLREFDIPDTAETVVQRTGASRESHDGGIWTSDPSGAPFEANPAQDPRAATDSWGAGAGRAARVFPAPEFSSQEPAGRGDGGRPANRERAELDQRLGHPEAWGPRTGRPAVPGHILSRTELGRLPRDPGLSIIQDPDGPYATAIRLLGTRVDEFVRRLGYRAYMLTSCEPLTGKTTVVVSLGFALTEDANRRVALVEANFRNPRFAGILGLPEGDGLLGVLQGRVDLARSVAKIEDRNLVILPAGGRHPHPAEVLASPRFRTLLAELAQTVDIALIDAPSIRPFADANLLEPMVDGVLLVVAEGSTPSLWLSEATAQIGESRVLGAVYNRLPRGVQRQLRVRRKKRLQQK